MSKTTDKLIATLLIIVLIISCAIAAKLYKGQEETMGSVSATNEYIATTTAWFNGGNGNTRTNWQITSNRGTLGSLVVTGAGDLAYNLYNATTTDFTNGNVVSSTAMIISVPASLAAGTYVFDTYFKGLLLEVVAGNTASTTITWRY